MRSFAEVNETTEFIEADRIILNLLDEFSLVRLAKRAEPFERFLARDFTTLEGDALCREFFHFSLDGFQVFLGESVRPVEVVVEPTLDCRPDTELRPGKKLLDGICHEVGTAVAKDVASFL